LAKSEWIRLAEKGTVHTFTIAGWSGKSSLKRLPFVLAYVIVDGCKTAIANELRGLDPWDAEFGMPVEVVWKQRNNKQGPVTIQNIKMVKHILVDTLIYQRVEFAAY